MTQPPLTITALTVHYGLDRTDTPALEQVDLTVAPGELMAVTGRSGSGKSTLLNAIGGLIPATSGSIRVFGREVVNASPEETAMIRRSHLGYIFQQSSLIDALTAAENVALPLELAGAQPTDAAAVAESCLKRVGLPDHANRLPATLSGGEQQRVAIARGLASGPGILLADEPTAPLDETTAEEIFRLIRQLCDEGASAMIVTHNPRQAAWADRVVRLSDGRISTITQRPETPTDLAGFLP